MRKKILVVDNSKVILKLLTHILEKMGLTVRTAEDGLSALEVLRYYHPDVIFIDLIMPNIGGENLCRVLRMKPEFSSTVLVILSAVTLETEVDFIEFGADACIAKRSNVEIVKYIELIMDHVEKKTIHTLPKQILGTEHAVKREITRELIKAKQNLEVTLENMGNGFLELSESYHIIYCNSLAAHFFNIRREELLATNILDHFNGNQYDDILGCLDRLQDTYLVNQGDDPFRIQGKMVVFRFISVTKLNERTIIVLMQDVTKELIAEKIVAERTKQCDLANHNLQVKIQERLKIHEELEFVARQWSKTFDTITDFVSVHDKNMKFVRVNRALFSFLGREPEELLGKYCYEIMHNSDKPWPECPHVKAIETGKTMSAEIEDSYIGFPLHITCSPLLHDDGSLMGSVHIARDISMQKKATNQREELINQLEETLSKVKQLSGFLPICASCKNIRDDKGYWTQVEAFIRDHSEAEFSHSICPACARKLYPELDLPWD
jgi:PAS domain S-box-containing protein